MTYARIHEGFVVELVPETEHPLSERFHPDYIATLVPASSEISIGMTWNGAEFGPCPSTEAIDLVALKSRLKAAIDASAEAERLRYITAGAGQAMTYARKVEQARAAQADADPQPGDYPLLDASVGIDGADILAVAATIVAMDAAWEQIGAGIEAARLNGKHAIDLAETAEAARAVEVIWPVP